MAGGLLPAVPAASEEFCVWVSVVRKRLGRKIVAHAVESFDARKFKMRQEECLYFSLERVSSAAEGGPIRGAAILHSGSSLALDGRIGLEAEAKLLRERLQRKCPASH